MQELIRSFTSLALIWGIIITILVVGICKRKSTGGTVSATPRPTFGEKEKERIRQAYAILQNIAEMSKNHSINGRYMQVFISDSERSNYCVKFDISIRYEYETSLLKQLRNTEEKEREIVLYKFFCETPYEMGADNVKNIVFGQYDTIEFSVLALMDKHVTRQQIIEEFKAMGIHDVSAGKSFTSFRMY